MNATFRFGIRALSILLEYSSTVSFYPALFSPLAAGPVASLFSNPGIIMCTSALSSAWYLISTSFPHIPLSLDYQPFPISMIANRENSSKIILVAVFNFIFVSH